MQSLKGKVIYVFGTGARKISLLPRAITELASEGAEVYTMMSDVGKSLVSLQDFDLPGNKMAPGYSPEGESLPLEDMVLVAPCTFNTLNKLAAGIADTYPLTVTSTAIGAKRKVIIAPAMNAALWNHPLTNTSIQTLQSWGCLVVYPEITLDKVTMAPIEKITDTAFYSLAGARYNAEQIKEDNYYRKLVEKHFSDFRTIGEEMLDNQLTKGSGGCLSVRTNRGILITSTGAQVGNLSKDELSLIRRREAEKIFWQGKDKPSSESPLICEIYDAFPSINAVVHGHCPRMTYDQKMARYNTAEYIRSGVFGQSERVVEVIKYYRDFAILKLHGELSLGQSLKEGLNKLKIKLGEAHERW